MVSAFEIKNIKVDLLAIFLRTLSLKSLASDLSRNSYFNAHDGSMNFFVLDFDQVPEYRADEVDLEAIVRCFEDFNIRILAIRTVNPIIQEQSSRLKLSCIYSRSHRVDPLLIDDSAVIRAGGGVESHNFHENMVIERDIRSGQQVYARSADLIVLGNVSNGADVIADGSIHIKAPMYGRALAGANGNRKVRIFIDNFQAHLVSIAGLYKVFDDARDLERFRGKKVHIFITKDNKLKISVIKSST